MRTFSPRPCATTVAFTFAPETNGVPTFTPSPSPSMSTLSNETAAPTCSGSSSTLICSPDLTRYCLPPVWITAYMGDSSIAKTWNYKGFPASWSKRAVLLFSAMETPSFLALVAADMERVDERIRARLGSDVVLVRQVAEHIIAGGGKR